MRPALLFAKSRGILWLRLTDGPLEFSPGHFDRSGVLFLLPLWIPDGKESGSFGTTATLSVFSEYFRPPKCTFQREPRQGVVRIVYALVQAIVRLVRL